MSKGKRPDRKAVDLHSLYEAAVQNVEADLDFIVRVYRKAHGAPPKTLREDFCGTASMAARFVARSPECRAWGVDLDRKTLDWGARHRVALLGEDAGRVTLVEGDVRTVRVEPVDVAAAFNFSYWIFRDRAGLGRYLRHVYSGLADGGVLVLDAFGGTESMCEAEERTRIPASRDPAGWKIPSFTYVWDQHRFNPIDHALQCFIHFELKDGTQIRRAFRYDWRFWTLPELQELLLEVGFAEVKVYVEGWDEESDEPDGIFRHRRYFENDGGWLAYLAAFKS